MFVCRRSSDSLYDFIGSDVLSPEDTDVRLAATLAASNAWLASRKVLVLRQVKQQSGESVVGSGVV